MTELTEAEKQVGGCAEEEGQDRAWAVLADALGGEQAQQEGAGPQPHSVQVGVAEGRWVLLYRCLCTQTSWDSGQVDSRWMRTKIWVGDVQV